MRRHATGRARSDHNRVVRDFQIDITGRLVNVVEHGSYYTPLAQSQGILGQQFFHLRREIFLGFAVQLARCFARETGVDVADATVATHEKSGRPGIPVLRLSQLLFRRFRLAASSTVYSIPYLLINARSRVGSFNWSAPRKKAPQSPAPARDISCRSPPGTELRRDSSGTSSR